MRKYIIIVALVAAVIFIIKKKDMTLRQSFLKWVYPIFMLKGKLNQPGELVLSNTTDTKPLQSFYDLKATGIDGKEILMSNYRGKKVLLVNTASDCGYTPQYEQLQELYTKNSGELVILGFPANDFKEQEKGSDEDIARFCKLNFGVTFPLMQKSSVIKNAQQNEVFNWLSDKIKNGWNSKQPEWNFAKYLVDENGTLTHYFSPKLSPLSKEVVENLK